MHLGALGAVVRSTCLLSSILRKYPGSQLTWVTQSPAHHLLLHHPNVHRVLTLSEVDQLKLSVLEFDIGFVIDKSVEATGLLRKTKVQEVFGFVSDGNGVMRPTHAFGEKLWQLGLDNFEKFHVNTRTEQSLLREALGLDPHNDEYDLPLFEREKDLLYLRRFEWSHSGQKIIVGINTGCAETIPAKKLSIENHRELIRLLQQDTRIQIVLLGGPEDSSRNIEISKGFSRVILSPTNKGLRDGLISVAACDLVVTGDSLGMHMAISQRKQVIAWFGPTCAQEIDLYGRGKKILSEASCGPCWKRSCNKPVMCYDLVNLDGIIKAINQSISESLIEPASEPTSEPVLQATRQSILE